MLLVIQFKSLVVSLCFPSLNKDNSAGVVSQLSVYLMTNTSFACYYIQFCSSVADVNEKLASAEFTKIEFETELQDLKARCNGKICGNHGNCGTSFHISGQI